MSKFDPDTEKVLVQAFKEIFDAQDLEDSLIAELRLLRLLRKLRQQRMEARHSLDAQMDEIRNLPTPPKDSDQ